MVALTLLILLPCFPLLLSSQEKEEEVEEQEEECKASLDCSKELHAGQFLCLHKDVDVATQQLRDCRWVDIKLKVKEEPVATKHVLTP